MKAVNDEHEIMMITSAGIIIQIRMSEVPVHGRITSGVKLINLEDGVKVVKIAKVRDEVDDGNGHPVDLDGEEGSSGESSEEPSEE